MTFRAGAALSLTILAAAPSFAGARDTARVRDRAVRWAVAQAFLRAGLRLSARLIGPQWSYRDARAHRRGLRAIPVRSVHRGDLLFLAFRPGLLASHLAIVCGRPRGERVATVEGNESNPVHVERRGLQYPVLAARVTG